MTLRKELHERIKSLEVEYAQSVRDVGACEVKLNVMRRWKNRIAREIQLSKADLEKLQESVQ